MRRITMFNAVSADGYFEAPGGDLSWVTQEPEVHKGSASRMPAVDTMLFGRKTYEMFERAWRPAEAGAPKPVDPHSPDHPSEAARGFADWINEHAKVVFSTTLKHPTWKRTRVVPILDVNTVRALKDEDGKDMIIFGSGSIVSQLSEHGLIDEYQFVVSPIVLGRGRQMVAGMAKSRPLKLIEATPYPSGVVMLRYAPKY
ncbi:MAG: dihydrofolate reductase family protein [Acidobacteriota bacterium]